jgi:alkylation response protein AidB-like acyl-CoA dehydrogenase
LDFQLTDEQRLISETARDFADKEIAPRVRENDRAGRFDRELASMLGEMATSAPRWPRSTAAAASTT